MASEIFKFESMDDDDDGRRTTDYDGRRRTDDGPLVYYKLTLWAFGSGELKSGNIIFPIISLWGYFLRRSRAANSVVGGPIWPKFELIHNIMHVLVTSKFEKDRININGDYVMTPIF